MHQPTFKWHTRICLQGQKKILIRMENTKTETCTRTHQTHTEGEITASFSGRHPQQNLNNRRMCLKWIKFHLPHNPTRSTILYLLNYKMTLHIHVTWCQLHNRQFSGKYRHRMCPTLCVTIKMINQEKILILYQGKYSKSLTVSLRCIFKNTSILTSAS